MRPTKEQLQDEMILAAIIAGGMASGREVLPSLSYRGTRDNENVYGVDADDDPQGPCCAVGAGVLFHGVLVVDEPIESFAKMHGVSIDYAIGVSDGFEADRSYDHRGETDDYDRGVSVGNAAFEFFTETGRG